MRAQILGETLFMNEIEASDRRQEKEEIHFETALNFLNSHNGFRPGKLHTFMGVSSGGKSTLLRSILWDLNINNPSETIGCIFSEETLDEVKTEVSKIRDECFNPSKITAISELNFDPFAFKYFDQFIGDNHLNILAWDNCTTSSLYEGKNPDVQFKVIKEVKKLANRHNIPVIIFAHTDGKINDSYHSLINMNDIRGGKGIVNLSEFFYILQRFEIDSHIFPTIRLTKFRGHDVASRLYYLHYKSDRFIYGGDHSLSFEDFKEAYKKRNVLR